jgi:hypothetical protein
MFGMRDEWQSLCVADDLTVKRGRVRVTFAGGRSHEVRIRETDGAYLLTAIVAGWDVVGQMPDPYLAVWSRNRHSRLVGFRVDEEGTMVAHGWTPKDGLTPAALQHLVRAVAREADRYEFQLTGTDRR